GRQPFGTGLSGGAGRTARFGAVVGSELALEVAYLAVPSVDQAVACGIQVRRLGLGVQWLARYVGRAVGLVRPPGIDRKDDVGAGRLLEDPGDLFNLADSVIAQGGGDLEMVASHLNLHEGLLLRE